MLVSATEMLNKAKAGHYAVGQFNINNLEWTKAILQTAQELTDEINRIERAMKTQFGEIRFSFFEPEIRPAVGPN